MYLQPGRSYSIEITVFVERPKHFAAGVVLSASCGATLLQARQDVRVCEARLSWTVFRKPRKHLPGIRCSTAEREPHQSNACCVFAPQSTRGNAGTGRDDHPCTGSKTVYTRYTKGQQKLCCRSEANPDSKRKGCVLAVAVSSNSRRLDVPVTSSAAL